MSAFSCASGRIILSGQSSRVVSTIKAPIEEAVASQDERHPDKQQGDCHPVSDGKGQRQPQRSEEEGRADRPQHCQHDEHLADTTTSER